MVPGYFEGSLEKFVRQHYLVEKVSAGWEEAAKAQPFVTDSGNTGSLVLHLAPPFVFPPPLEHGMRERTLPLTSFV